MEIIKNIDSKDQIREKIEKYHPDYLSQAALKDLKKELNL